MPAVWFMIILSSVVLTYTLSIWAMRRFAGTEKKLIISRLIAILGPVLLLLLVAYSYGGPEAFMGAFCGSAGGMALAVTRPWNTYR